jgi:hypothetical protein
MQVSGRLQTRLLAWAERHYRYDGDDHCIDMSNDATTDWFVPRLPG